MFPDGELRTEMIPFVPYASNPNRLLLPPGGSATGCDSNDAVTPFSKAYVANTAFPAIRPISSSPSRISSTVTSRPFCVT